MATKYPIVLLVFACIWLPAHAVCTLGDGFFDNGAKQRARDQLYLQHQCNTAIIEMVNKQYNFPRKRWDEGWGWNDCSENDDGLAFPRAIDAAHLLLHGIDQPNFGGWHDAVAYGSRPNGDTAGVGGYRHQPSDSLGAQMTAFGGIGNTDRVVIRCSGLNYHVRRFASALLHEAEHFFLGTWRGTKTHGSKLDPVSGFTNPADEWFDHPSDTEPENRFQFVSKHSMYQVQVEFLCDLANYPAGWITFDVVEDAVAEANATLIRNIKNPPGWMCSIPRPLPPLGHFPEITLVREEVARF